MVGLLPSCNRRSAAHRRDQSTFLEGLFQDSDGIQLRNLRSQGHIRVCGHENGWQRHTALSERRNQLQTRHLGHTDIGDNTAADPRLCDLKKIGRLAVSLHRKAARTQETCHGIQNGRIIINKMNNLINIHKSGPSCATPRSLLTAGSPEFASSPLAVSIAPERPTRGKLPKSEGYKVIML